MENSLIDTFVASARKHLQKKGGKSLLSALGGAVLGQKPALAVEVRKHFRSFSIFVRSRPEFVVGVDSEGREMVSLVSAVAAKMDMSTSVASVQKEQRKSIFTCKECGESFSLEHSHVQHAATMKHASYSKEHKWTAALKEFSCEVCGVKCQSQKSFNQHKASKKHLRLHTKVELVCHLCSVRTKSEKEFNDHLESKKHQWELQLRERVKETMKDLESLYQRAVALLDNAGVDMEKRGVNGLTKALKKLGLGCACITCLKEYSMRELRIHLLEDQKDHIYSKRLLKEEKRRVLEALEKSPEEHVKAKLVFAVKNALLVRLFARR